MTEPAAIDILAEYSRNPGSFIIRSSSVDFTWIGGPICAISNELLSERGVLRDLSILPWTLIQVGEDPLRNQTIFRRMDMPV